jgi:hypothetical protein
MAEFVLNRNYDLSGPGHRICFKKGVPTFVPPDMVKAAVAIGADCLDGKVDVLDPEVVEKQPMTAAEKEQAYFAAFDLLIERNDRDDFGGDGKPSVAALQKLLDFSFTKKERDAAVTAYRALKAEEQKQVM